MAIHASEGRVWRCEICDSLKYRDTGRCANEDCPTNAGESDE